MSNKEEMIHHHHDTIKITLEDDSVMECKVLTVFDCNDKEYLALVPEQPETEGDVFLYDVVNVRSRQYLDDFIF